MLAFDPTGSKLTPHSLETTATILTSAQHTHNTTISKLIQHLRRYLHIICYTYILYQCPVYIQLTAIVHTTAGLYIVLYNTLTSTTTCMGYTQMWQQYYYTALTHCDVYIISGNTYLSFPNGHDPLSTPLKQNPISDFPRAIQESPKILSSATKVYSKQLDHQWRQVRDAWTSRALVFSIKKR